ncbi:hypothetical protein [Desertivirga brevis]|uniref:hypothetical protein n=1 Tax=Desertivirga brevis TaxID=2810310 RepID=UPI001A97BC7A|nr:hypothetical protein [Pedobacter sp. SYSU D00873]
MRPIELAKDFKAAGIIVLMVVLLTIIAGIFSAQGSRPVKLDFVFFPGIQKALGIRIPASDFLDSTANH